MKNIFFCLFIFAASCCFGQNVKHVDAVTFKKLIDEKKSVLIDLRTTAEIQKKGMIRDAIQIDYFAKDAGESIAKLDRNKTYLIYCAGGGRSGECGDLMQKLGFNQVVNLEKGFDDWKTKGYEVIKN
ncbi:MAG: rhodanese-like domain-containing protein [Bacteroidota bacterium]